MPITFIEQVHVHYGFVSVMPADVWDHPSLDGIRGQRNGLIGTQVRHALGMVTGLHTGPVPFTVTWHESEPAVDATWEEVVEVSWEVPAVPMRVSTFDESQDVSLPAGWTRARFCATGMDAGKETDTAHEERAPDRCALDLWAAEPALEEIVRSTSTIAAYWHGVARGDHR